jgi:deoxyribodipyrimidine photo-lyase
MDLLKPIDDKSCFRKMQNPKEKISVFWFRRDLRLEDNIGLFHALNQKYPVLLVFIFDKSILNKLKVKNDRRLTFIHNSLLEIEKTLNDIGSGVKTFYSTPLEAFQVLNEEFEIKSVFTNSDYEPYAIKRDKEIQEYLQEKGIEFHSYKDQVIFEKDEIRSNTGGSYTVFTPYSKKWKSLISGELISSKSSESHLHNSLKFPAKGIITLSEMGFDKSNDAFPAKTVKAELIEAYAEKRNFPFLPATSRLSVHLRFGTVSIRELVRLGLKHSETWLNELIWREFYMSILWNFPHVGNGKSFKSAYEDINWRNNEAEFQIWCEGKTGYPIVDAGMRELNETGFMHNRVRMIVASFLVKHLLVDWRWGEAYFAEKLLDFDLSANNGGWQWASGSGCDAAPYFRVFNPTLQMEKFDKEFHYIKKWVPEYNSFSYMNSMVVNHEFARKRVLEVYKKALDKSNPNIA